MSKRHAATVQATHEMTLLAPSRVRLKTVFTVCAGVTLFGGALLVVWSTPVSLLLSIAALMIAVPLDRAARLLCRLGLPRPFSVATVMLSLLAALTAVTWLLLPPAVTQVQHLVQEAPEMLERLQGSTAYDEVNQVVDVGAVTASVRQTLQDNLTALAGTALSVAGVVVSAIAGLVMVLFLTAFMLAYGRGIVQWSVDQATPARAALYRRAVERSYHAIGGYVAGLGALVLANMTVTTVFLALIGIPYFLPLGILCGLASIIPVVGATFAGAVVALVGVLAHGIGVGVAVAIYIVVYQQVENQLLAPLVYRQTISLNPLLSILVFLFMGELAGIAGAVLAVPTLAILKVAVTELLALRAVPDATSEVTTHRPGGVDADPIQGDE
jgi:predicted PurR-regulated permease PerM